MPPALHDSDTGFASVGDADEHRHLAAKSLIALDPTANSPRAVILGSKLLRVLCVSYTLSRDMGKANAHSGYRHRTVFFRDLRKGPRRQIARLLLCRIRNLLRLSSWGGEIDNSSARAASAGRCFEPCRDNGANRRHEPSLTDLSDLSYVWRYAVP